MLYGIGNDIIEVSRIEAALARYGSRFLDRLFTQNEQDYCLSFRDAARHLAGRFAAKEAVVKSLGTGIGSKIGWLDIEILNDGSGKPSVKLSSDVLEELGSLQVLIAISHCKEYATAFAVCQEG